MSRAITFHIEVEEESDSSFRFNYNNSSTGLPMNLTGFRAEMQVLPGYAGDQGSEPALIFTSEPNGGILLGGVYGTVDLFISYEDTKDKYWDQAKYTLYLINPAGGRSPFAKGFFTINRTTMKLRSSGLIDLSTGPTPDTPDNLGPGGVDS